jgi:hypothetical protein
MDTLRPDERAAGVISGSDPYRELELYLEKVNVSSPKLLVAVLSTRYALLYDVSQIFIILL